MHCTCDKPRKPINAVTTGFKASSSSAKPLLCISVSIQELIGFLRSFPSLWFCGPTCQSLSAQSPCSLLQSMRIRKNASKLLGSAIVYSSAPFPPPSDAWDPPCLANPNIFTSSGELCELNQSPWDVYPNLHFFTSSFKVKILSLLRFKVKLIFPYYDSS